MSNSVTSLLIAFVGIVGTLASGLLTQRAAERSKARELEHAERQRLEDRRHQEERATVDARRVCYVALNTAALDYHSALNNLRYALVGGTVTEDLRSRLDVARQEHRAQHSQAQMAVPDVVLEAAQGVNIGLNRLYGILKRIDGGFPPRRPGESIEVADKLIKQLWDQLAAMMAAMRADIGASVAPAESSPLP
ncbi:hypothetical protein [Streptomyces sp. NPDC053048]|uniref:hypothetical protein n=1 Tax=Streptomyces sp. NPDC053048 TaxID=3365694 RepID=UPI0037CD056A